MDRFAHEHENLIRYLQKCLNNDEHTGLPCVLSTPQLFIFHVDAGIALINHTSVILYPYYSLSQMKNSDGNNAPCDPSSPSPGGGDKFQNGFPLLRNRSDRSLDVLADRGMLVRPCS